MSERKESFSAASLIIAQMSQDRTTRTVGQISPLHTEKGPLSIKGHDPAQPN
jgi:hypothetical protein